MRRAGYGLLLLATLGMTSARGEERDYGAGAVARLTDPPRWRWRATLLQGFGVGSDGGAVARFPTTVELGAHLFGPLSLDGSVTATLAGEQIGACGRPHAVSGALGLRGDLANGRSAAWVDPFLEVHGGVGAQGARCREAVLFGGGGARLGVDAWLGRAAVTAALTFDYLPLGSVFSFSLGGTFALF